MAKPEDKKDKQPAPQTSPATENKTAEPKAEKEEPSLTPEQRAEIVAKKQAHGQLGKPWICKAGTDIPQRFDKAEFAQYESKRGATLEETVQNMLAFVDGENDLEKIYAVQDKFNGAHRLEKQKDAKDLMKDPETTNADVQDSLNEGLSGQKRRGTGKPREAGKLKKALATADAATQGLKETLAELEAINPAAAQKMRERYAALGVTI